MNQIDRFLTGASFCDDLAYRPQIISHVQDRGDLLTSWVSGRRVLHVGFADHVPLIASRIRDGSWLHARLSASANACLGIDISTDGVATARSLGFVNVLVLDIFSPQAPARLAKWNPEMVLVPDVIEHLPNPAAFLRRLVDSLPQALFVVTVPNALSLRNTVQTFRGVVRINTDHRSWFSPFTLQKILADAGLKADSLHACPVFRSGSLKGRLLRVLSRWRPMWADVLLVQARKAQLQED